MKYLKNIACAAILAVPLAACTPEERESTYKIVEGGARFGSDIICAINDGDDCFSDTAYYTTNGKLTEAGEKFLARHVPLEKRAAARAEVELFLKQHRSPSARVGG